MTADPEEQRLRDAVVELSEQLVLMWRAQKVEGLPRSERNDAIEGIRERLCAAVDEWRDHPVDHGAKASAPEPAPRCEPPEQFRGFGKGTSWHWLESHGPGGTFIEPWSWAEVRWRRGEHEIVTAERMAEGGWRYHSPALPDTRVEPWDEAIADFTQNIGYGRKAGLVSEIVRSAVAHFTPTQPTDDHIREIMKAHGQSPHDTATLDMIKAVIAQVRG